MSSLVAGNGACGPEARGQRATLVAALLGFFVITLDAVVVNVALPTVGRDLQASVNGLQWVVDSYTLVFAALLLSAGALSDRVGARRAFGYGLLVFTLASVACGVAPSLGWLVFARFLQGAGAAALMPSSMALVRLAFPEPGRRTRALAAWAMGGAIAATSGPVVGGLLSVLDWRWIFFVNVPVDLATGALLLRVPASPRRQVSFDLMGQATAVLAMGALTFGAIEAGERGLFDPLILGVLALALVALVAFVRLQRVSSHPIVPPGVLAPRNARIAMVVGFTFMAAYFGMPFVMSLYLQQQRGLSSLQAGLAFLPMMVVGLVLTSFSALAVERWGARASIVGGLLLMALGLVLISVSADHASTSALAVQMMLVGLAGPLVAPPATVVLLSSVPSELAGTASGVFHTSRQVGGAMAVAVFGALLAQSDSFMTGLHRSLWLAAATTMVTACISTRLIPIGKTGASMQGPNRSTAVEA